LILRERPFHIVNCLKLFNFTLLFVYTLKLLKGPLCDIFLLYFEKRMTFSRACGSRVVHQLLNKTMQKLSAEVLKRGPETTALFAFPDIHPCSQLHTKEPASFYNKIELIKVLCNVIKIFFDHSLMLRIT